MQFDICDVGSLMIGDFWDFTLSACLDAALLLARQRLQPQD
jgi:hypothetical protein